MVLACKSDLEKRISPSDALFTIQKYAGLVEVSNQTDSGKKKMRRSMELFIKMLDKAKSEFTTCFHVLDTRLLKAKCALPILFRLDTKSDDAEYRNPVSPDVLSPPAPWNAGTAASNDTTSMSKKISPQITTLAMNKLTRPRTADTHSRNTSLAQSVVSIPPPPYTVVSTKPPLPPRPVKNPSSPPSPTRTRSMNDLSFESQRVQKPHRQQHHLSYLSPQSLTPDREPMDRKKTRSIVDIAKASRSAAASNVPITETDVPSSEVSRSKSDDAGANAMPVTSPAKHLDPEKSIMAVSNIEVQDILSEKGQEQEEQLQREDDRLEEPGPEQEQEQEDDGILVFGLKKPSKEQ